MNDRFDRPLSLVVGILLTISSLTGCARGPSGESGPEPAGPLIRSESGTPNPPRTLTVSSEILGQDRRVYLQLPEGYDRSMADYPIVVVLDGEWLFELVRASVRFYSEYEVMDPALPKMIVVGIENVDRDRDYVPTKDPGDPPTFATAGGADAFLDFLELELFPLLDTEFRTASGRTVVGWSFGGLAALYTAVSRPELFDAYLCIGPAIWWDDDLVVKMFRDAELPSLKRMVVTLGSLEEGGLVHTSTTRLLRLLDERPVPGLEVTRFEIDGVGHSWGIPRAIDLGLRELFNGFIPPDEITGASMDEVEGYYRELSGRWGFEVEPPASVLLAQALKLRSDGDVEGATRVLEHLTAIEPDTALGHYYLGKIQEDQGNTAAALERYRDALAAELRRDVPKGIFLGSYRKAITRAETAVAEQPRDQGTPRRTADED